MIRGPFDLEVGDIHHVLRGQGLETCATGFRQLGWSIAGSYAQPNNMAFPKIVSAD